MRGGVILCIASAGLTIVAIATDPALSGATRSFLLNVLSVDIRIFNHGKEAQQYFHAWVGNRQTLFFSLLG